MEEFLLMAFVPESNRKLIRKAPIGGTHRVQDKGMENSLLVSFFPESKTNVLHFDGLNGQALRKLSCLPSLII